MLFASIVSVAAVAHAGHDPAAATGMSDHVPHLAQPAGNLYTGGQPDAVAWRLLAAQGIGTVINLRGEEEMRDSDEAVQVAAAGMRYVSLPINGAGDVTRDNAARLHQAIDAAGGKVLVHCASGNRVGALLAIDAAGTRGLDVEQAIAYGRSAGLSGLEARVREVLVSPVAALPTR